MLEVNQLPLNSFFMAARVSLDSSCDERGVNALCQLPLSSSRKFEDGEDLLFESSIMRSPTTTSEAKTINAIASPFMPPFPLPLPWAELDLPRGAGPDDHAFPPVLQKIKSRSQKQYITTYILKKKKKEANLGYSYSRLSMPFSESGTQPVNSLSLIFLPVEQWIHVVSSLLFTNINYCIKV